MIELFLGLILSIYLCILVYINRNRKELFLVYSLLFLFTYSIYSREYLFATALSVPMYEAKNSYGPTFVAHALFVIIFTLVVQMYTKRRNATFYPRIQSFQNSISILYTATIICFLFYFYFNGYNSSDLNKGYVVRITPIYEYSLVLFVYLFSIQENKVIRALISFILIMFATQDVVNGGRIFALQAILLLVLFTFPWRKFKIFPFFVLSLIGYSTLQIFAATRTGQISLNESILSFDLLQIFGGLHTASFAYYATATHFQFLSDVNLDQRLAAFFYFISYVFSGSAFGITPDLFDATKKTSEMTLSYGGGLIYGHFYYWLGWPGVLLSAYLVAKIVTITISKSSSYNKYMSKYSYGVLSLVICFLPRWFLYTPLPLFRAIFFFTLVFILGVSISKLLALVSDIGRGNISKDIK